MKTGSLIYVSVHDTCYGSNERHEKLRLKTLETK